MITFISRMTSGYRRSSAAAVISSMSSEAYLHHLQLLRIGQIPRSWFVASDISLDVNVGPVDQPLLNVLQHLLHHCVKGTQLCDCRKMRQEVSFQSDSHGNHNIGNILV